MIELNAIVEATTPIEISLGDYKIPAVVRLNAVTKEFVDSIRDDKNFGYKLIEKNYVSIEVAVSGKPVEITVENLKKLPVPLIDAMADAVKDTREELKKQK